MRVLGYCACALLVLTLNCHLSWAQVPPRLNIPGAVLLSQPPPRPHPGRQHNGPPQRLRRPNPNQAPLPIRPVVEEPEEAPTPNSPFEDEVSRLGISALQTAVRQAAAPQEEEAPRPLQFRPERPLPILRQDIREHSPPVQRLVPVVRQEQRPILRQEQREDVPLRQPQPVRHAQPRQQIPVAPTPQGFRQVARPPAPRQPQYQDGEENHQRTRKPTVAILKKFRTDNADGSITWGYENEDGSFKEETLGVDCVTRGKYGYIDPDGVRREYSYETGNKCDEPELEEEPLPQQPQARKPQFRPSPPAQF